MPSMRIPFTGPLPPPRIIPQSANTIPGAVTALSNFLSASKISGSGPGATGGTVCLTGAGISVASGLNDYRGPTGTYIVNKTYRPIYYNEFLDQHESRKRYWARSFIGFTPLRFAKANAVHRSIKQLGSLGYLSSVVTQNVDSFHQIHPELSTVELHGFLRSNMCVSCGTLHSREEFQSTLAKLNPAWAELLDKIVSSGALNTDDPSIRTAKGLRTNPDGDVDLPDAPYSTFRYPPCPKCLDQPPKTKDGSRAIIKVDNDGAWMAESQAGVLKPAVVMFGEAVPPNVKEAAEGAIDHADRLLVIGSSLATFSAWRLAKRAQERNIPIGILNLGGTRGEDTFFHDITDGMSSTDAFRCNLDAQKVLPAVVEALQ